MFDINDKISLDESIASYDFHSHHPFTTRFKNNDEIRIPVPEDLCTRPHDSYLYIEGQLVINENNVTSPAKDTKFVNNGIMYLFSEIRYEINSVVVDSCYKPGVASTMKGLVSFNQGEAERFKNAGWFPTETSELAVNGKFSACIPLKMIFGFAEDYKKTLVNIPQQLVLIRSNSDTDALICSTNEKAIVDIDKIYWRVPHVVPGLKEEIYLTNLINKNKDVTVPFRTFELHSYPALPTTTKHTWPIKTSTNVETPRYIIIGFQTKREGDIKKNMSEFDHCNFNNIRVYLNADRFPYKNLNINFTNNQFGALYEMFARFREAYYYEDKSECLITPSQFKSSFPLIVVDCSKQKSGLPTQAVSLRIEFDTNIAIPADTTAFCLLIHDRIFTYNLQSKAVKQI